MILLGSRYENADIDYILDPRTSETRPTVFRPYLAEATSYVHVWNSGDRLDIIANQKYGDPGSWWRIMDANPSIIDPSQLRPGMVLRIP